LAAAGVADKMAVMAMKINMIGQVLVYSGRVQGVGFRQSTVELAKSYNIAGTVCNLPDGRVEAVLEGTPQELEKLEGEIKSRFAGFITDVIRRTQPVQGLLPPVRVIW
jgi:acylphosphatase